MKPSLLPARVPALCEKLFHRQTSTVCGGRSVWDRRFSGNPFSAPNYDICTDRKGAVRILLVALLVLPTIAACKRGGPAPTEAAYETSTICTRCKAAAVIKLASPVDQETWPKQCPSCKRWHAYPTQKCAQCGKPVPLIDERSMSYGTPKTCPHCGSPWSKQ